MVQGFLCTICFWSVYFRLQSVSLLRKGRVSLALMLKMQFLPYDHESVVFVARIQSFDQQLESYY